MICKSIVLIMHHYDIGDQGVYLETTDLTIPEIKDIATYLSFTAELTNDSIDLENMIIAQFLEKLGAKILEEVPSDYYEIDLFFERERRCGTWYDQDYDKYNQIYGAQAKAFLQEKNII